MSAFSSQSGRRQKIDGKLRHRGNVSTNAIQVRGRVAGAVTTSRCRNIAGWGGLLRLDKIFVSSPAGAGSCGSNGEQVGNALGLPAQGHADVGFIVKRVDGAEIRSDRS